MIGKASFMVSAFFVLVGLRSMHANTIRSGGRTVPNVSDGSQEAVGVVV